MGACSLTTTAPATMTQAEIRTEFAQLQRHAAVTQGSEYSGGWNMMSGIKFYTAKVFDTKDEAEDYVLDNTEKWENALAVQFDDKKGTGSRKSGWLIGGWAAE